MILKLVNHNYTTEECDFILTAFFKAILVALQRVRKKHHLKSHNQPGFKELVRDIKHTRLEK